MGNKFLENKMLVEVKEKYDEKNLPANYIHDLFTDKLKHQEKL